MSLDKQNERSHVDEVKTSADSESNIDVEPVGTDGRIFSMDEIEENLSLIEPLPEKKYSVDSSQKFSQYLSKDVSSRYRAIVLNVWTETDDTPHYDVGLVQIKNS